MGPIRDLFVEVLMISWYNDATDHPALNAKLVNGNIFIKMKNLNFTLERVNEPEFDRLVEIKLNKGLPKLGKDFLLSRKEGIGIKQGCHFKLGDFLESINKRMQYVRLNILFQNMQELI